MVASTDAMLVWTLARSVVEAVIFADSIICFGVSFTVVFAVSLSVPYYADRKKSISPSCGPRAKGLGPRGPLNTLRPIRDLRSHLLFFVAF